MSVAVEPADPIPLPTDILEAQGVRKGADGV